MKDESRPDQFERRAREAFDASIEAMDADTRSRLRQSRHRAVAAATQPRWKSWAPVGALAAGVLGAALLLRGPSPEGPRPRPMAATPATLTQGTIEMIAAGDEFEIATADEALEFYRWVEQATTNGAGEGRS
ncbi:MAG TPA: hypothetical protein VFI92_15400 [Steroidobacteraceae bacterium]|nr:hypothetical protein [Steroidobacteraceae bacterium]